MGTLKERMLRGTRRVTDIMPLTVAIAWALLFVGELLPSIALSFMGGESALERLPAWVQVALLYVSFLGIWVVFLLAMGVPKGERPMLTQLGHGGGNTLKGLLQGLVLGFATNAICIVISLALGDIGLSFAAFEPVRLLVILLAVAVQSGAEEVVCRLYVYQKLRRRYQSPAFAIVVSAVFFSALHVINPGINVWGIMEIVLMGVLLSIAAYYYHSLWAAIAIHTAWNYSQNIVFGLPNSGIVSSYSIFHLSGAASGLFFDAAFGVEGSVGACAVTAAVCVALLVVAHRKGLAPDDLWAPYEQEADAAPEAVR